MNSGRRVVEWSWGITMVVKHAVCPILCARLIDDRHHLLYHSHISYLAYQQTDPIETWKAG